MGRNFGVEYDESDLMNELNELDEEIKAMPHMLTRFQFPSKQMHLWL